VRRDRTILADQLGIYRSSPASSPSGPVPAPLEVAMKARLTRLAYSLAALAALAAALGAGRRWH
jgi:hypothetical protein